MKKLFLTLLAAICINNVSLPQTHRIVESTSEHIKIEFNFEKNYQVKKSIVEGKKFNYIEGKGLSVRLPGEPWIPNYNLNVGIPHNAIVNLKVLESKQENIPDVFIIPIADSLNQPFELLSYNKEIYNSNTYFPGLPAEISGDFVMRYARLISLSIAPYQFNPISRDLIFNKKLTLIIEFKPDPQNYEVINNVNDKMTDDILKSSVINYNIAKEFIGKPISDSPKITEPYWYNPQKDYFNIYLNKKGVYRVTCDMLVNAGVPAGGLQNMQLELFNNGESIPIDVVDVNNDNFFNSGDYFQFVGGPAKPVNEYTRKNIYNLNNVYWFSYQADSLNYYKYKDGNPTFSTPFITNSIETLNWEQDNSFQRFGHALNGNRDYWFWGGAEAINGMPTYRFEYWIEDSIWSNFVQEKSQVKLNVGLHGLTAISCSAQNGHNATVYFNYKPLKSITWNGQESALFEKDFHLAFYTFGGGDTAQINWGGSQNVIVQLGGNICDSVKNDIILINYLQFQYWRWHKTFPNHFFFTSPPNDFGINLYYLWLWKRDNMKVYIPSRKELIFNPLITNDADFSVQFQDTINEQTDYYCVANDYYELPDSIIHDSPSDLRNLTNGADYIIITHPQFKSAAQQLAEYRSSNLSGYSSPRVKVVDIQDVYDEFSSGLLNPYALQYFAKYAFESWQIPAPAFIVLLGDASYDYRSVYSSSRKNFVPSIPFHALQFGQLPSDNLIGAVAGNDISPDISIGRLSCETSEEANILVDKILNYPADNSKPWKENVILLASGISYQDQISLGFNKASKRLENLFLSPNGINTTKVFNYPDTTSADTAFYGSGPRMRQEINKGAVLVNYYGHGGGGQWDLIFTKDDIPELMNGNRLPIISSITCYTAHFENAESFGEVFTKIPNKGAIGFWGSVGLTWWQMGQVLNDSLYKHIFNNRNYVIGSAILSAKALLGGGLYDQMLAQLSYLGDPAVELALPEFPDFEIKSSGISIFPKNPVVDSTITVTIKIRNWGLIFPNDSVTVELFTNSLDTTNLVGEVKLPSFGNDATTTIDWTPQEAGLYTLIARINEKDVIDEMDHSDNIAFSSFSVFDFGEPNIIRPVNGYFTENDRIDFVLADVGFYFNRQFNYRIQINDSPEFNIGNILIQSPILNSADVIVRWQNGSLMPGEYFWRALIYDAIDTNISPVKIFTITDKDSSGYLAQKKHLQLFDLINIDYYDSLKSLILNTELKPPHPEPRFLLDSIQFSLPPDSTQPATFTTDGKYFYYGEIPFWDYDSKIYKIGTGLNGSIAGHDYGSIPNVSLRINSQLFCKDGYLFTNTGDALNLLQINPENGDTNSIALPDSLLLTVPGPTQWGGYYFYYDGKYLYNLAVGSSLYPNKFVLRKFDPSNNWYKVGEDIVFNGTTMKSVMSFIVVNGYLIVYENYNLAALRRFNLSDGSYEEEWIYSYPPKDYYTIAYDYQNNFVYFSSFRPVWGTYEPGFFKYAGTYKDAYGFLTSQEIGPASKWHNLEFEIDQTNSNGQFKAFLSGKNKSTGVWSVLDTLNQPSTSLTNISASDYNYLKLVVQLVDSSFGGDEPMKFKSLLVNYDCLPEISIIDKDLSFIPDSALQGIDITMSLNINNLGYVSADSLRLDFYNNLTDTIFYSTFVNVPADTFININKTVSTNNLLYSAPVSPIDLKVVATSPIPEYYTFNNLSNGSFYVVRDSANPLFNITFDGREIINGDIISSEPEVVITLEDNSPLPLDSTYFTIVHTFKNIPKILKVPGPDITFDYSPYPNSRAVITWKPKLEDGKHVLEVFAKDASGNPFDSTSSRSVFNVFNNPDLLQVYNYPNPFKDNTSFTFELRGIIPPQEFKIKIFTVAGRLIRIIDVPISSLHIGFNTIAWDGRDEDGDEIANGLYFYKIISKHGDEVKTVTQKLAKVK